MMQMGLPCGFDESTAGRYLAGRLTEPEAEAFEAHYFACDACWAEVRRAQELRAGLGPEVARRTTARRRWLPLAAAAALVAALGTWMLVRSPDKERVFRTGQGSELAVTLSPTPEGPLSVSWSGVAVARVYRVRVSSAEGTLLAETELPSPPFRLDRATLPAVGTVYVTVQALGPDREVLASSRPVEVQPGP